MSAPDDAVAFYQEVLASPDAPRWSVSSTSGVGADDHAQPWQPVARPSSSYQPARVNVPWLVHLAGEPSGGRTGAALDRQPLLRALAGALPELTLFVEPPLVARGVPGEAFVGAGEDQGSCAEASLTPLALLSTGGPLGRTAAAHRARAQKARHAVDYTVAAALLVALQAWYRSEAGQQQTGMEANTAVSAALADYGARDPAERVQLLVTITLCGIAQRAGFIRGATEALPGALFAGGPSAMAAALALPERVKHLLPAYAALNDFDQGAIRAAVDAHQRLSSVCCGEAPPQVLAGLRLDALQAAVAAWMCLRAGSPSTARSLEPHPVDPYIEELLHRVTASMAAPDAPLVPQKHVVTAADAPAMAFDLLRVQCCGAHPLFDADCIAPFLCDGGDPDTAAVLHATLRVATLVSHVMPHSVMTILRSEQTVEDVLLSELGGGARHASHVGPQLALPGLAAAGRCALHPGSPLSATRAVLAGLRALCAAARDACLPYDGDACGVWTVDCTALHAAMRRAAPRVSQNSAGGGSTAAAVRFASLCEHALVSRQSVSCGVVEVPHMLDGV